MGAHWLVSAAIVAVTVLIMEWVAASTHRYVMHGVGWRWHRSHHDERTSLFELNDLYAVGFAGISVTLFAAAESAPALWWVGLGMVIYGLLYALLHDVLVHRRLPVPWVPRRGYLNRLVQAHRLHHSVHERDGAVSFGFLYAPPVQRLADTLRASRGG